VLWPNSVSWIRCVHVSGACAFEFACAYVSRTYQLYNSALLVLALKELHAHTHMLATEAYTHTHPVDVGPP